MALNVRNKDVIFDNDWIVPYLTLFSKTFKAHYIMFITVVLSSLSNTIVSHEPKRHDCITDSDANGEVT